MSVQLKFFSIPIPYEAEAEAELNRFLKTIRMVTMQRHLVQIEGKAYWAIVVEYMTGDGKSADEYTGLKKKIDYKEVLTPEKFAIFARLRDWRKETAAKEAVQLYTIFTNDQMAAMTEKKAVTKNALKAIDGVGDARVEKYGNAVLSILKEEFQKLEQKNTPNVNHETNGKSLPFDPDPRKPDGSVSESSQKKTG